MTKLGLVQTVTYNTDQKSISNVSKILKKLGRKETEIVCLPEQWLKNNHISDWDLQFKEFKEIARDFGMTIIPGAFYETNRGKSSIVSPIIGPKGEFIGKQEKIHPFDYEKDNVQPGKEAKIFKTACKFGIIICYDMVFPQVANTLAKKGAQVLLSPSRIVKRGIDPWQMYVQVRSLENRIPILAANVENHKFGGNSLIVDLHQNNKVITTKITKVNGEQGVSREFDLKKYEIERKKRFSDYNKFQ
ncbi:nitrilase/cyanide hydratase and apolipoprotein N-acyltransferase [Candidatus Nitrosopumilus koreensis AR1]|uniref:Nitrilase/cyanide hydratase and apolipoprotein N-acyltransferase n=1 Tax=Candidatus Nitrosopumilus koreensis AR1 TaxID=1229908 RepID=K0B542_9ARCH|nr:MULTISPECIES: carbon-nitrogen hydrolase family protein [Nitrosopumilus]AFS80569.1 nitrilase/cyanide hydratase and apolipoprotein N-acyltransferase [Candidatus Nitrosopumilus koreensis AR1]